MSNYKNDDDVVAYCKCSMYNVQHFARAKIAGS